MVIIISLIFVGLMFVLELKYGMLGVNRIKKDGIKGLLSQNSNAVTCQHCGTEGKRRKEGQICPNCYQPI